jgi:hypothetical protein
MVKMTRKGKITRSRTTSRNELETSRFKFSVCLSENRTKEQNGILLRKGDREMAFC